MATEAHQGCLSLIHSQVYIVRAAWKLTASLWLWNLRSASVFLPWSLSGKLCESWSHYDTRAFISWMSAGHTQHPSQRAPGSGCSVCCGTHVHCTLSSRVYQENMLSPWWMGSVLHLHESGLPRRDKELGDASLAVPVCATQKWWMGLMHKQCWASTHQAQLMWYLFRGPEHQPAQDPVIHYPSSCQQLTEHFEPVLARCCR